MKVAIARSEKIEGSNSRTPAHPSPSDMDKVIYLYSKEFVLDIINQVFASNSIFNYRRDYLSSVFSVDLSYVDDDWELEDPFEYKKNGNAQSQASIATFAIEKANSVISDIIDTVIMNMSNSIDNNLHDYLLPDTSLRPRGFSNLSAGFSVDLSYGEDDWELEDPCEDEQNENAQTQAFIATFAIEKANSVINEIIDTAVTSMMQRYQLDYALSIDDTINDLCVISNSSAYNPLKTNISDSIIPLVKFFVESALKSLYDDFRIGNHRVSDFAYEFDNVVNGGGCLAEHTSIMDEYKYSDDDWPENCDEELIYDTDLFEPHCADVDSRDLSISSHAKHDTISKIEENYDYDFDDEEGDEEEKRLDDSKISKNCNDHDNQHTNDDSQKSNSTSLTLENPIKDLPVEMINKQSVADQKDQIVGSINIQEGSQTDELFISALKDTINAIHDHIDEAVDVYEDDFDDDQPHSQSSTVVIEASANKGTVTFEVPITSQCESSLDVSLLDDVIHDDNIMDVLSEKNSTNKDQIISLNCDIADCENQRDEYEEDWEAENGVLLDLNNQMSDANSFQNQPGLLNSCMKDQEVEGYNSNEASYINDDMIPTKYFDDDGKDQDETNNCNDNNSNSSSNSSSNSCNNDSDDEALLTDKVLDHSNMDYEYFDDFEDFKQDADISVTVSSDHYSRRREHDSRETLESENNVSLENYGASLVSEYSKQYDEKDSEIAFEMSPWSLNASVTEVPTFTIDYSHNSMKDKLPPIDLKSSPKSSKEGVLRIKMRKSVNFMDTDDGGHLDMGSKCSTPQPSTPLDLLMMPNVNSPVQRSKQIHASTFSARSHIEPSDNIVQASLTSRDSRNSNQSHDHDQSEKRKRKKKKKKKISKDKKGNHRQSPSTTVPQRPSLAFPVNAVSRKYDPNTGYFSSFEIEASRESRIDYYNSVRLQRQERLKSELDYIHFEENERKKRDRLTVQHQEDARNERHLMRELFIKQLEDGASPVLSRKVTDECNDVELRRCCRAEDTDNVTFLTSEVSVHATVHRPVDPPSRKMTPRLTKIRERRVCTPKASKEARSLFTSDDEPTELGHSNVLQLSIVQSDHETQEFSQYSIIPVEKTTTLEGNTSARVEKDVHSHMLINGSESSTASQLATIINSHQTYGTDDNQHDDYDDDFHDE